LPGASGGHGRASKGRDIADAARRRARRGGRTRAVLRPPLEEAKARSATIDAAIQRHRANRPGFVSRLFRTTLFQSWMRSQATLASNQAFAGKQRLAAEQASSAAVAALENAAAQLHAATASHARLRAVVTDLTRQFDDHRAVLGPRIVDEIFFARSHEVVHLEAPWVPDGLHRKREELFIAAMAVHRAFIDAAAQKVLHNLSILMGFFSGGPPQDEARRALLGDLWSTLFLVVPVISTTFASVEAMLGELVPGDIGWLLIDEAGQALPQAASAASCAPAGPSASAIRSRYPRSYRCPTA
jgi:hypothetical protein